MTDAEILAAYRAGKLQEVKKPVRRNQKNRANMQKTNASQVAESANPKELSVKKEIIGELSEPKSSPFGQGIPQQLANLASPTTGGTESWMAKPVMEPK